MSYPIFKVVSDVLGLASFASNLLLLLCVRSSKVADDDRLGAFLSITAVLDMIFSICFVLVKPVFFLRDGFFIIISLGPIQPLPRLPVLIATDFCCFLLTLLTTTPTCAFIYRYYRATR